MYKIDISKWALIMMIFGSYIKVHQRAVPEGNYLNDPVDLMTTSGGTSQLPSPATPVTAQQIQEQSGLGARDGYSAIIHGCPLTKVDLAVSTAEHSMCQQQRPIVSFRR